MTTRRLTDLLLDESAEAARARALDESVVLRFGKVTAVHTATRTITCTMGGATLRDVPYSRSYTPANGDVVWLLHQGSVAVAIGAH